jgi:hypothetical protein
MAMFKHKLFDVDTVRDVAGPLRWPTRDEVQADSGLGGNRHYYDLRGITWDEAREVYASESAVVARIEQADDPEQKYNDIENEWDDEPDGLMGLDMGVASLVATLSAARCVPFASCSGGAFGGHHHEVHPLVAFYARRPVIALLLECAERVGAGLVRDEGGHLVVYANDIRKMRMLAAHMINRQAEFDAASVRRERRAPRRSARQLKLFD